MNKLKGLNLLNKQLLVWLGALGTVSSGVVYADTAIDDNSYVTQMKRYQQELALSSAQNEVVEAKLKRAKMNMQLEAIKNGDAVSLSFASAQSSPNDLNTNTGSKLVINKSQTFTLMGVSGPSSNLVASLHYDNSLFPVKKDDDISGKWRVLEVMPSYVKLQHIRHSDDIRVVYLAHPVQESSDEKSS